MPRVSVALPVYNGEPYLAQTLADLRAQTETDWEAVICDNASTDATPDLLADAARDDARIRVVRNDRNLGALPNSNKALALTTAPLVCLWGHDDRHHPSYLGALAEAVEATPGAVLAYPDSTLIGPDGVPFSWDGVQRVFTDAEGHVYDYDRLLERELPNDAAGRFRAVLETGSIDAPIHGVFRREALMQALPFTLDASDRHALARIALLGRFVHISRPLFGYRIHPGSTYFLDPEAWAQRETGGAASSRSGLKVLANYARMPFTAPLALRERAEALSAVAAYALRQRGAVARRPFRDISSHAGEGDAQSSRWSWLRDSPRLGTEAGVPGQP